MRLKNVPVVSFTAGGRHRIDHMFAYCEDIEEFVGLEGVDDCDEATALFKGCTKLKKVGNITLKSARHCESMFAGCAALQYVG